MSSKYGTFLYLANTLYYALPLFCQKVKKVLGIPKNLLYYSHPYKRVVRIQNS